MPTISRGEFEKMIKDISKETGVAEEIIRADAEAVAKINNWQIEEPNIISLITNFSKNT